MHKKTHLIFLFLFLFNSLYSCSNILKNTKQNNRKKIKSMKHWGYQLQNYSGKNDLTRIFNSKNFLWVIDYSKNGNQKNRFKKKNINLLKENNNLIISYLSIGEAEDYRYYFKKMSKDLLLKKNIEFQNNFKIKFWEPKWKEIFIGKSPNYLDYIIEQGFDGIYLDIVDAFLYFPKKEWKKRAKQMVDFIIEISKYTRKKKSDFIIIQQNASEIFKYLDSPDELFKVIDALALESVFFSGKKWNNNILNIDNYIVSLFKDYQNHSIPIFSVEYISDKKKINHYFKLAQKYNLIPVVAQRNLKGTLIFAP